MRLTQGQIFCHAWVMSPRRHALRCLTIGIVIAATFGCVSTNRVKRLEAAVASDRSSESAAIQNLEAEIRAIESTATESKREVDDALLHVEQVRRQIGDVSTLINQKRNQDEQARADLAAKLDALQKSLVDVQNKLSKL